MKQTQVKARCNQRTHNEGGDVHVSMTILPGGENEPQVSGNLNIHIGAGSEDLQQSFIPGKNYTLTFAQVEESKEAAK